MRHPCDVVLSNFMQNYGMNAAMASFFSLKDTTFTYEQVMGLWLKYIQNFQVNFQMIKYEMLLSDFNGETRRLLDFLEVDWDDDVVNYHQHAKNRGIINTPSYQSVTEPIYHHASYRWKRYEAYLNPYIKKLTPFINEFGY